MPVVQILIAVVLPCVAWYRVAVDKRPLFAGWRARVLLAGLVIASLSSIAFVGLVCRAVWLGGFGTDFPSLLSWVRPGLWLSIVALGLCVIGAGPSRGWAVAASIVILALWVIPVLGM